MEKPKSPCLNCPDRVVGCHATCEKYQSYDEKQKAYNEFIRQNKEKSLSPRAEWSARDREWYRDKKNKWNRLKRKK